MNNVFYCCPVHSKSNRKGRRNSNGSFSSNFSDTGSFFNKSRRNSQSSVSIHNVNPNQGNDELGRSISGDRSISGGRYQSQLLVSEVNSQDFLYSPNKYKVNKIVPVADDAV